MERPPDFLSTSRLVSYLRSALLASRLNTRQHLDPLQIALAHRYAVHPCWTFNLAER